MCIGAYIIERNLELSQTKEISTRTYTSSSLETSKKANKKKDNGEQSNVETDIP